MTTRAAALEVGAHLGVAEVGAAYYYNYLVRLEFQEVPGTYRTSTRPRTYIINPYVTLSVYVFVDFCATA